ncbi:hypothetical protein E2562_026984 [Oryza meyeriana var. granulata]|uniref:Uncharacterized protein n=1 Tax=Oryza meyeriana var. granulata TaxID=110450 RepID=A0A6G1EPQ0_9ORYZ|nr:hypothetical protein E2562_026984 [Oryza meyeriana var. granulata]
MARPLSGRRSTGEEREEDQGDVEPPFSHGARAAGSVWLRERDHRRERGRGGASPSSPFRPFGRGSEGDGAREDQCRRA